MSRTKGALGKKTLEKLEKLKTVKTIADTKPKRKRRTKAEMEEEAEQNRERAVENPQNSHRDGKGKEFFRCFDTLTYPYGSRVRDSHSFG